MTRNTRREFLAASATAVAAASIAPAVARAAHSANETVVLALVGAGGRGQGLAAGFAAIPNVRFKYVCDCFQSRAAAMAKQMEKLQGAPAAAVSDMRKVLDDADVHGVILATPEHWHALGTIWACQAGKDVYVEKNPSLTVWEGRKMIEAARKYKRVVQAGFQNRSAPYALSAREYLRSGKLGKVVHVKAYNMLPGGPWQLAPDSSPPAGLDWDRWLGPARLVPYNRSRHTGWYDWYDYCGGAFSGDASHTLDLARIALGDPPPPRAAYCAGGNFAFGTKRPTPEIQVVTYEYPDYVVTCEHGTYTPYLRKSNQEERYGRKWPFWPQNCERIEIYGTKQMMYLGRHGMGWQVFEGDGKLVAEDKGYFPDKYHQADFVDCIRSRRQPNGDIAIVNDSANLIHMGNVSYRIGDQRVVFDAKAERFDSEAANRLLRPEYREKYSVPEQV